MGDKIARLFVTNSMRQPRSEGRSLRATSDSHALDHAIHIRNCLLPGRRAFTTALLLGLFRAGRGGGGASGTSGVGALATPVHYSAVESLHFFALSLQNRGRAHGCRPSGGAG